MTVSQFQRHLIRMNDLYQSVCRALAEGEIPEDEARRRVNQLSYTDLDGRTWLVDTTKSGHTATFTDGTTTATIDHHVPDVQEPPLSRQAEVPNDADDYSFAVVRRRLTPMLAALGLTVALAGIPIAYVVTHQESSSTANYSSSSSAPALFTVPIAGESTVAVPTVVPTVLPGTSVATNPAPTDAITTSMSTAGKTIDEIPFETEVVFGTSVQGRALVVERRGEAGGVRVLVFGVIHGNEQAGLEVVKLLQSMDIGEGVDLWLVPMVNPDGVAANIRQNANRVDLNRNFPHNWQALGEPGYWEYAGPSAGSEPEVMATMALSELITPDYVVWYHQDYFRINPTSGRAGEIRARYAALVDLPLRTISGGTYTGTAGSWVGTALASNGVSMLVEFGVSLREGEAQANADAVLTIVEEFFGGN